MLVTKVWAPISLFSVVGTFYVLQKSLTKPLNTQSCRLFVGHLSPSRSNRSFANWICLVSLPWSRLHPTWLNSCFQILLTSTSQQPWRRLWRSILLAGLQNRYAHFIERINVLRFWAWSEHPSRESTQH